MKKPIKELIGKKSITALLYIALGIVLIVFRGKTPEILCRFLGAGFGVIGLYNLVYHIVQDELLLGLPSDLILIVLGAVVVICADVIAVLLAVILGIVMLLKAIFGIQSALISRKTGSRTWIADMIYAIVGLLLGLILIINPLRGSGYLSLAMGLSLVVDGVIGLIVFIVDTVVDSKTAVTEEDCVVTAETIIINDDQDK